jgi:lipopolysaccharide export system permease protein
VKIIDRYIGTRWLSMLLICESAFLACYLLFDFISKYRRFSEFGAGIWLVFQFFLLKLPEMISQTINFAVLMATLITLGLFSRSNEITVFRSSGISLVRITMPIFVLAVIVSGLMLINVELIVPQSYQRMAYVEKFLIKKQPPQAFFRLNNIWFRSNNYIIQAKLFNPMTKQLQKVVVWELDPLMEPVRRLDAEYATVSRQGWLLHKIIARTFSPARSLKTLEALEVPLKLKIDDLKKLDNNADTFSFIKLRSYANSFKEGGYNADRYLTMMHSKLSTPFGAIVMVILGVPFALKNGRSGDFYFGMVISIVLGFVYFLVNSFLQSYGRSGTFPPLIAAWGANLLFIVIGAWLGTLPRRQ